MSIARLPYWILTEKHPAFYDADSKTAVEMVSKVYGKIQELVDDYNKFVDNINKEIKLYEESTTNDQKAFEERITKVIHDYIDFLDSKVEAQDKVINDTIIYIKNNLKPSITEVINEMKESGEFDEAVSNAFNNLGDRVANLELSVTNNNQAIENINQQINEVNNRKVYLEYTEETKELNLIVEGMGVEN